MKPFLSAALQDGSGSIEIKVWDYAGPLSSKDDGCVVYAAGQVSEYRGSLQAVCSTLMVKEYINELDPKELQRIVKIAPIDVGSYVAYIEKVLDTIQDEEYAKLGRTLFERHKEALMNIPAGRSVHHSFLHGLLMHTVNMLRMATLAAKLYAPVINYDLLLVGTLLHDLGKEIEFEISPLGLVKDYSIKGILMGHLVLGAAEVRDVARELNISDEKSMLVQHMLLSHHGQPEFGAAVYPCCAEAELLCLLDMLDSRMEICAEKLDGVEPGTFTDRLYTLGGTQRLYQHN